LETKKLLITLVCFSVICMVVVGTLLYLCLFQLGFIYWGKEDVGKYHSYLFSAQYNNLNQNIDSFYRLPDQYTFYGRYAYTGEKYEDGTTDKLSIVNDRMVRKDFFEYSGQIYYLYYANEVIPGAPTSSFNITYPDVYNADTDKIAFSLMENPEGCFILDNYLYYAYGKNYLHVQVFTWGFITGHDNFIHSDFKDFHYARMNLDTLKNENISKRQFEEKYNKFP